MVVSGLPDRTIDKHAGEIARMSLDLLSSTTTFRIPHLPDCKVQLRIGIHSGKFLISRKRRLKVLNKIIKENVE